MFLLLLLKRWMIFECDGKLLLSRDNKIVLPYQFIYCSIVICYNFQCIRMLRRKSLGLAMISNVFKYRIIFSGLSDFLKISLYLIDICFIYLHGCGFSSANIQKYFAYSVVVFVALLLMMTIVLRECLCLIFLLLLLLRLNFCCF